jgi:hypothetical protein
VHDGRWYERGIGNNEERKRERERKREGERESIREINWGMKTKENLERERDMKERI